MEAHAQQRRDDPAVLIPAYEPGERLVTLVRRLSESFSRIVVVDDGSTRAQAVFDAVRPLVETVLVHPANRGKGAALRTGFAYLGATDVITVDADGQHAVEDVLRLAEALRTRRGGLVLGVRLFGRDVPFRSRWGNWWTRQLFRLLTGISVRDTQTGLRGIPGPLVPRIAALPGDRYEFEMVMLADARHHAERPLEVPIRTIYFESNADSHFAPLADTLRIYGALLRNLFGRRPAASPRR